MQRQRRARFDNGSRVSELAAKNAEQQKLFILAEKIEAYRADEDGIKDAIPQCLAPRQRFCCAEAKAKAGGAIVSDANAPAEKIVNDARKPKSQNPR